MLTLPIKEPWFSMILSGEKKEEYREIKPYYTSRFHNVFGTGSFDRAAFVTSNGISLVIDGQPVKHKILFRNGYGADRPEFVAVCSLSIGTGREEWGAESGKEYYTLTIHAITEKHNYTTFIRKEEYYETY
jgi:hypothetical protein